MQQPPSGEWVSLREHLEAQRESDLRLETERDRRYTEVSIEREKALKIKEVADLTALSLAREIQTYKDEKANELRSQIERERGSYATQTDLRGAVEKVEATIKPIADYVASQQGRRGGAQDTWSGYLPVLLSIAAIVVVIFMK